MDLIAYLLAAVTVIVGAKVTADSAWVERNKILVGTFLIVLGLLGSAGDGRPRLIP